MVRRRRPAPLDGRGRLAARAGTGELDFRPIFAAGRGKARYHDHEQDGGSINDANISPRQPQGHQPATVGTAVPSPRPFPSVAAGTAAADQLPGPIKIENSGDAPADDHQPADPGGRAT